jgi:hypothetical protein
MQVIGFLILIFIFSYFEYASIKLILMGLGKINQIRTGIKERNKRQIVKGFFLIVFISILLIFYILIVLLGSNVII